MDELGGNYDPIGGDYHNIYTNDGLRVIQIQIYN